MSLDISLKVETPVITTSTGIYVKNNGSTKELSIKEVKEKFPDTDIELKTSVSEYVYETNITHNLTTMADKAGLYEALWRPHRLSINYDVPEGEHELEWAFEEANVTKAEDIIEIVKEGLNKLKANPSFYKKFNAQNGWGTYEQFVPWLEEYLENYPEAVIEVSR